jgi:hypothetical protein
MLDLSLPDAEGLETRFGRYAQARECPLSF